MSACGLVCETDVVFWFQPAVSEDLTLESPSVLQQSVSDADNQHITNIKIHDVALSCNSLTESVPVTTVTIMTIMRNLQIMLKRR